MTWTLVVDYIGLTPHDATVVFGHYGDVYGRKDWLPECQREDGIFRLPSGWRAWMTFRDDGTVSSNAWIDITRDFPSLKGVRRR